MFLGALVRDPTRAQQAGTIALSPVPVFAVATLVALALPVPHLPDLLTLAAVFVAICAASCGPRWAALGGVSLIGLLVALLSRLTLADLPPRLAILVLAALCAGVVRFVLLADRPATQVHRLNAAIRRGMGRGAVLHRGGGAPGRLAVRRPAARAAQRGAAERGHDAGAAAGRGRRRAAFAGMRPDDRAGGARRIDGSGDRGRALGPAGPAGGAAPRRRCGHPDAAPESAGRPARRRARRVGVAAGATGGRLPGRHADAGACGSCGDSAVGDAGGAPGDPGDAGDPAGHRRRFAGLAEPLVLGGVLGLRAVPGHPVARRVARQGGGDDARHAGRGAGGRAGRDRARRGMAGRNWRRSSAASSWPSSPRPRRTG